MDEYIIAVKNYLPSKFKLHEDPKVLLVKVKHMMNRDNCCYMVTRWGLRELFL